MKRFVTILILVLSLLAIVFPVSAQDLTGRIWGDDCADGSSPRLVSSNPEDAAEMLFYILVHGLDAAQEAWEVDHCINNGGRVRELNPNFSADQPSQLGMDASNANAGILH